jgi:hypothetical protein
VHQPWIEETVNEVAIAILAQAFERRRRTRSARCASTGSRARQRRSSQVTAVAARERQWNHTSAVTAH